MKQNSNNFSILINGIIRNIIVNAMGNRKKKIMIAVEKTKLNKI